MLRVVEMWESNIILKPKYIKKWRIGLVVLRTFGQDCSYSNRQQFRDKKY